MLGTISALAPEGVDTIVGGPASVGAHSTSKGVHAPDPGGAFGGKQHAKYEPLLAFLALATGRPVRLVLTLEETFQAVRRGASRVHVRTGFRRDGSIVFRDLRADYLIGAYADIADRTVGKGSFTSNGPYRVPNVRIRARSVLSNTVPFGFSCTRPIENSCMISRA